MKVYSTILITLILFASKTYSQFLWKETLYNKYEVSHKGLGKFNHTFTDEKNQIAASTYYYTPDSIISNSFFFCAGLCISNVEEPYYFIRLSTLPNSAMTLYYEKSALTLNITFIKGNEFSKSVSLTLHSPQKLEDWNSTTFGGIDWKSNCNIFKIKATELIYFTEYTIGKFQLASENNKFHGEGSLYTIKPLFEQIKNGIKFSSLK